MVMPDSCVDQVFWAGKKVFLTGHSGFKGGWLTAWLAAMGARVTGYSLPPETTPSLSNILGLDGRMERSILADIRDLSTLQAAMRACQPDVVIHMAAQPLVRKSYREPVETYATNVMGTVHVLQAVREVASVRAVVVVTTDKCYENREWVWGYREDEPMGGFDPYSNSKGCAELVVAAYRNSFFAPADYHRHGVAIASARAGNVIGGGDWSDDRLIPDAIRAFESNGRLLIRNPNATRPWQHVLEPLSGYLMLGQKLFQEGVTYSGAWNLGPDDADARTVGEVIDLLVARWGGVAGWDHDGSEHPHEARFLKLDCSKAKQILGWRPRWNLEAAIDHIVAWHAALNNQQDMRKVTESQIDAYLKH
jgi:CDP-glucose 4,6-dehydratase